MIPPFILTTAALKIRWAEKLEFLPLLGLRLWLAAIFWKSGFVKLDDWEGTKLLFAEEYKVPLLPPDLAAFMGTGVELLAPIMLVLGLGARVGAFLLLSMTLVIEFTYQSFPVHQIWALVALLLICRGPGLLSLDYFIRRKLLPADKA